MILSTYLYWIKQFESDFIVSPVRLTGVPVARVTSRHVCPLELKKQLQILFVLYQRDSFQKKNQQTIVGFFTVLALDINWWVVNPDHCYCKCRKHINMEFLRVSVQNTLLVILSLVCVGWRHHHIYCMLTAELRSVTLWYRGVKIAEINTGTCGV